MADAAIIDVDVDVEVAGKDQKTKSLDRSRNTQKRKRLALSLENLSTQEKEAYVEALNKELDELFGYYKEVKDQKVGVELTQCSSRNAVIAVLMEESELPLSRLVDQIYDRLKNVGNGVVYDPVTYASVKSSVLFVGQRLMYGVPNADADILEDDSESCFWCWETRDLKLIPISVRRHFIVRRTCRRRIHERIMAVSEMIAVLKKPESEPCYKHSLIKASEKFGKAYAVPDIRLLVDGLMQKNSVDMAMREARREEKLLLKQLERNRRYIENENKGVASEMQKEILLSENDLKLFQGEARKEERSEKDGFDKRKQHRKQPEEVYKDQRRQEKEEAELKKKRALQKQASLMERFLKRSKPSPSCENDQFSTKAGTSESLSRESKSVSGLVALSMDCSLASSSEISIEDVRKSHFSSWRCLGQSIRSSRKQGWGLRQKPKTELFKELKLTANRVVAQHDELGMEKHIDGLGGHGSDVLTGTTNADTSLLESKKCCHVKQLLQFDKSHRPAFYGIWPMKSHVVGPRHPFRKDPSLDYDISSDEEWEEEDPGESLSDCDKDEEESLEECSKSDNESEDGFFVPDGYLSEDEGAQVDRTETDVDIEGAGSSTKCKDIESEEFCNVLRQQKYLNNLTEHALRRNQPLVIPNLMHDKDSLLLSHHLSGTHRLELMCLQALSMRLFPGGPCIEISMDKIQDEDQETCLSTGKSAASDYFMAAIPDSDLPTIVKKEVLVEQGVALYPEKSNRGARSIATFFSKRCLPPSGESVNPGETSPL